ncbi:M48 family metalloprotease [Oligosphaera ethanolica]|uniref:Tetratricopeptide (TPR) repeat protein n=1 Tax=Oligosphaera ethanolica TaxID=760260 RepID=A0AAE3VH92_9BACT|nr:M48 family metalloprotease [Oligosphaera ethanolica]MDQ0290557.1 tetratricopeptide (TPR) repeat protein [Oligosphaera ethanolica]
MGGTGVRIAVRALAAGCLCLALAGVAREAQPGPRAADLLRLHGGMAADSPPARRAAAVFARIYAVADRSPGLPPLAEDVLTLLEGPGSPLVLALPDDRIAVNRAAVALCVEGVSEAVGDTRLAFLLGHELGHLTHGHFRDLRQARTAAAHGAADAVAVLLDGTDAALAFADGNGLDAERRRALALRHCQAKEIAADQAGLMHAALAGYQVWRLIEGPGGEDFFDFWMSALGRPVGDGRHPDARTRATALLAGLRDMQEAMATFDAGLRLASMGQTELALAFFSAFHRSFPSRAAATNIGACHLALGCRLLPGDNPLRRHAGTVMWDSGESQRQALAPIAEMPAGDIPEAAAAHFRQSAAWFARAAAADQAYAPAKANEALALACLGPAFRERAVQTAREAIRLDPSLAAWLGSLPGTTVPPSPAALPPATSDVGMPDWSGLTVCATACLDSLPANCGTDLLRDQTAALRLRQWGAFERVFWWGNTECRVVSRNGIGLVVVVDDRVVLRSVLLAQSGPDPGQNKGSAIAGNAPGESMRTEAELEFRRHGDRGGLWQASRLVEVWECQPPPEPPEQER